MKKAYLLIVLFLCGLSVGNIFAAAPAAGRLGRELIEAAKRGEKAEVEEFIAGADVNARDDNEFTVLMWAAARGHTDIVDLLLQKGAEIDATDRHGRTALMLTAAMHSDPEIVKQLLDHGADKNIQNNVDETAEKMARKLGQTEIADMIRDYRPGGLTKSAGKR